MKMPHVSREKFPYPISGVSRENITHPQSFTTFFPQVACAMQFFMKISAVSHENFTSPQSFPIFISVSNPNISTAEKSDQKILINKSTSKYK